MNILPKKRWHVRNKDNVARVRRDEQLAKEEAEEAERRRDLSEKEARLEILRKRLVQEKGDSSLEGSFENSTHLNLFREIEEGSKGAKVGNKEYEKEKKEQQESFEKKIGLLTYLGQSVTKDESPWYLKTETGKKRDNSLETLDRVEEKKKRKLDPMVEVEKYLKAKTKKKTEDKHKKHKRKYKEIEKASAAPPSSSIELLRSKRLKREKEERARANQLTREKTGKSDLLQRDSYDPSRYSSQYNPEFVRKPKTFASRR
ncbi:leukocyte receptor cluster member 1 homolog [Rhopilema esculentum]|uniref:leukocyte receptor cluster member 1 homolog n=1 Tax=Rhopilema esculentum TaxID=499914 RepID=UPI0031E40314